jgi:hypothetical protein
MTPVQLASIRCSGQWSVHTPKFLKSLNLFRLAQFIYVHLINQLNIVLVMLMILFLCDPLTGVKYLR